MIDSDETTNGISLFKVEDYAADLSGNLFLHFLINRLLNVSNQNMEKLDLDFSPDKRWVLCRLVIEFKEPLKKGQTYILETWISNIFHQFYNRNYSIYNAHNQQIVKCNTVWSLINMENRQSQDIKKCFGDKTISCINDQQDLITMDNYRKPILHPQHYFEHKTSYADIDINKHVNSGKYIELSMNLLDADLFQNTMLKQFEITYVRESFLGDLLKINMEELNKFHNYFEIRNKCNNLICRSLFTFQK